jgi:uncharacterized cupin superfamily protein
VERAAVKLPPQTPEPRPTSWAAACGPATRIDLSGAGGLTQFGAWIETLPPGSRSSTRHWHSAEDEMLVVQSGRATVIDDDGPHDLGPGDAACWPHGVANGHHAANLSDSDVTWLVIGARVADDLCTYPDTGETLHRGPIRWTRRDAAGRVIDDGDTPAHLRDLPAVWGTPVTDRPQPIQRADTAPWQDEPDPVHPVIGRGTGPYRTRLISDPGGLSQFGAFIEELPPGSCSGHRHWHTSEDEMVMMLSGEVVLVEETETPLHAGDVACWPAGVPVAHRMDNRSAAPARYLVIGTRLDRDAVHYADHDLVTTKDGPRRLYRRRDGTLLQKVP